MRAEHEHAPYSLAIALALTAAYTARGVVSLCLPDLQRTFALDEPALVSIGALTAAGGLVTVGAFGWLLRWGLRPAHVASVAAAGALSLAAALSGGFAPFAASLLALHAAVNVVDSLSALLVMRITPAYKRTLSQTVVQGLALFGPALLTLNLARVAARPGGWRLAYAAAGLVLLVSLLPLHACGRRMEPRLAAPAAATAAPARWMPSGRVLLLVAIQCCVGLLETPIMIYPVYHAVRVVGLSPGETGQVIVAGGVLGVLAMVLGGVLGDRLGVRGVAAGSWLLRGVSVALFYGAGPGTPGLVIGGLYALLLGSSLAALTNLRQLMLEGVEEHERASAMGLLGAAGAVSALASMLLLRHLVDELGISTSLVRIAPLFGVVSLLVLASRVRRPRDTRDAEGVSRGVSEAASRP